MSVMRHFSIPVFPWGKTPPTLSDVVAIAERAEQLGYYSVNMPLINTLGPHEGGPFARFGNLFTLDALTLLPAMVMATKTIRIAVDGIPLFQLPPFGWAKYFASLDVISNGRIIVGACLGWGEEAFATVGMKQKYRGRIADEQLEVITRLWTEDNVTHEGRFYQLYNVTLDPKPVQKPYPPIWIGGRTPSIPRAGRYADCLDVPWPSVEEARTEYIPKLAEAAGKWGRQTKLGGWYYARVTPDHEMPPEEVNDWFADLMDLEIKVDPVKLAIAGSPDQCASKIRALLDVGVEHFVLDFQRHGLQDSATTLEQMTTFHDTVVPLL